MAVRCDGCHNGSNRITSARPAANGPVNCCLAVCQLTADRTSTTRGLLHKPSEIPYAEPRCLNL